MPVTIIYMQTGVCDRPEKGVSLPGMDGIRVLIGDAQYLFADALGAALSAYSDFTVLTDHPRRGIDVFHAAADRHPHIALLDYWLPDMDGATVIRELHHRVPDVKVITLSWFHGPEQVQAALQAGAVGFLPKGVSVAKVAEGLRRAHQGEDPVFGEKVADLVDRLRASNDALDDVSARFSNLTAREIEILQFLSSGLSVVAIARRLGITEATARTHISRILTKTEAGSQLEAVTMARVAGLVP